MCVGIPGENILLSIVLAFRLDGRKRFEYSACGPVFFLANREKNILRFQKYLNACGYVIIFSGLMIDSVSIPGCPVVPAVLVTWVTSTVAIIIGIFTVYLERELKVINLVLEILKCGP